MTQKLKWFYEDMEALMNAFESQENIDNYQAKSILVHDELWISNKINFFKTIMVPHIGQSYIQYLLTPICYGKGFYYKTDTNIMYVFVKYFNKI